MSQCRPWITGRIYFVIAAVKENVLKMAAKVAELSGKNAEK
jgi:hypothetical protein